MATMKFSDGLKDMIGRDGPRLLIGTLISEHGHVKFKWGVNGQLYSIPEIKGVGCVASPARLAWWPTEVPSGCSWDPRTRGLVLTGTVELAGGASADVTLQATVDEVVVVDVLEDAAVFSAKLLCLPRPVGGSGRRQAGETEYLFPWAPLRAGMLPYLREVSGPAGCAEGVGRLPSQGDPRTWTVEFVGGVRRSKSFQPTEVIFPKGSGAGDASDAFGIAVWPQRILPKWRYYVLSVGAFSDSTFAEKFETRVWDRVGDNGEFRPLAPSNITARRSFMAVEVPASLAEQSAGPRYLELVGKPGARQADGAVFALLPRPDEYADRGGTGTVGVDFGTTNTVFSTNDGPQDHVVCEFDFAGNDEARTQPRVVNPNVPGNRIETEFPWLVTVSPKGDFGGLAEKAVQIPSGVFRILPTNEKRATWDVGAREKWLPFLDYAVVGPTFTATPADAEQWRQDLKWDDSKDTPTRQFLVALLLNVVAALGHKHPNFAVRASYPRRFTKSQKDAFSTTLANACSDVAELSGAVVGPAAPSPYADESHVLLEQGTGSGNETHLVLAADLGGGTLDLALAIKKNRQFRLLASESVRFGARLLVDRLVKLTAYDGDHAHAHLLAIERVLRRDKLSEELERIQSDPTPRWKNAKTISFKGDARTAVTSFRADVELFFAWVAEYCARFAAGSLLDTATLRHRLQTDGAPGDLTSIEGGPEHFHSLPMRCVLNGNGWSFLSCAFGPDALASRFKDMLSSLYLAHLTGGGQCSGRVEECEWKGKEATAVGLQTLEGKKLGEGCKSVASCPNGHADRVRHKGKDTDIPWHTSVGEGSDTFLGKPPSEQHEALRDSTVQCLNTVRSNPAFFDPQMLRTREGRDRYTNLWRRQISAAEEAEDLRQVRAEQERLTTMAPSQYDAYRQVPTMRALWEGPIAKLVRRDT